MKRTNHPSSQGFTLVELLVVIAIIGMLASMLGPSLNKVLGRARAAQCLSQLHQMAVAIQLYARENNDRMPVVEPLPSRPIDPANPMPSLYDQLLKYVDNNEKVFRCPRDTTRWPVEGASYEWCYPYINDLVDAPTIWTRAKETSKATILWDYDNVHGDQGGPHTKNVLFADGHVSGI